MSPPGENRDHRLSVLYFSNEFVRGGVEEHILTLLHGLDRSRFRPHLACTPELAGRLAPDLPGDVTPLTLELHRPGQWHAMARLGAYLRRERIDLLHSHLFYASLFASPVGWACRVPVILETPHVREQWRSGWIKSRFWIDRFAGRFVDRYVAVSHANARYLVDEKGLPPRKVTVIHNGCDLSRFDPLRAPTRDLRGELGLPKAAPLLVVVARLEPQKGHRVLLDALARVRATHPDVHLACVGEGSLRGELEQAGRRLGISEAIRFVGYQSDPSEWLAAADVVVLPSFFEGLPLVAVEALAAGRPMVATAVDGTPEVVVDQQTGLTVPPGDAGRLAEAISRLLHEPDFARSLARAGRQWVVGEFSREKQLRETESLYRSAWANRRRGGSGVNAARVRVDGGDHGERPVRA